MTPERQASIAGTEEPGHLMPEPRCPECGSRDSVWGERCPICREQAIRDQREARSPFR